jgi:DNA-binding NarL/FixJ family response regulator
METTPLRAGFIDDHPALLAGLVHSLSLAMPELEAAVSVSSMSSLFSFRENAPEVHELDIVLLDPNLGDGTDAESNVIALASEEVPVLLYATVCRPSVLRRCLRAGAWGIVSKLQSLDELADAIRRVVAGQPYLSEDWVAALAAELESQQPNLSEREADVLRLYAAGVPAKSVGRRLGVSYETVLEYLQRIRRKYKGAGRTVTSRTDLYIAAVEDGHIDPPQLR